MHIFELLHTHRGRERMSESVSDRERETMWGRERLSRCASSNCCTRRMREREHARASEKEREHVRGEWGLLR